MVGKNADHAVGHLLWQRLTMTDWLAVISCYADFRWLSGMAVAGDGRLAAGGFGWLASGNCDGLFSSLATAEHQNCSKQPEIIRLYCCAINIPKAVVLVKALK